jgi:3'-phosphoadenosine 5'-phosphosulfate sulfotransferase (PAPS reductase)/FAD synthetase
MLGRKQNINNEEWLHAVASIESLVSRDSIKKLAAETLKDIKKHIKGVNSAYSWSGGKDSIVLSHLCQKAGITKSLCAVCNLEYPAFRRWIDENKPDGCEIVNTGQDLAWLSERQWMIFPDKSDVASRWYAVVQHHAQRQFCKDNDLDIMLLGRRRADGNFIGRGQNSYTDGNGTVRFSPLAYWRHEDILAYIHYNALPLPPIYDWHNGYKCGTHPWPARPYTNGNGWVEVYAIDTAIVEEAATFIPSAAAFLEGVSRHE